MSDPIPPKSDATPPKPQLWKLDPNEPQDLDVVAELEAGLAKERRALQAQITEERRAARWLNSREPVKISPELRQDPAVQTAIIVAAAQEIKVDALLKGMADKYKAAPEIHADATGPEDLATRLSVGSKVVRASKGDVAIIDNAEKERAQACEDARIAVGNAACALGIKDDVQVNCITNALATEAQQNMQRNALVPVVPKAPEGPVRGR